jgi:hypothetical protein
MATEEKSFWDNWMPTKESIGDKVSSVLDNLYIDGGTFTPDTTTNLLSKTYDFNYRVFPNDLGMDYYGHYMVININVPTKGFNVSRAGTFEPAGNFTSNFTDIKEMSTVDRLRFGAGTSVGGGDRAAASIPRQTTRIAESIALFMPTGLNFNSANDYEALSLAETAAGIVGGSIGRGIYNSDWMQRTNQLGRNPINPGIEVVFITSQLRQFQFLFLMAPKNQQESENMEEIIRTLRFHSAPEINTGLGGVGFGLTWIPPAEFDIMFFNKGVENRHLPRINTCVLERVELDYNPQAGYFSTFSNGYPVQVQMTLHFTELEPIHKRRVLQGIY